MTSESTDQKTRQGLDFGPIIIAGVPVAKLAAEVGTPLYVYDEARLRDNYRRFHGAFSRRYPCFRTYFSMKANFVPGVVGVLVGEGAGLDCSSAFDVSIAKNLGVPGSSILYTASFPDDRTLAWLARGDMAVNFNDRDDFSRFVASRDGIGPSGVISFRLDLESTSMGNGIALSGSRFGMTQEQCLSAFEEAVRLGFSRLGIHAMLGSNITNARHFGFVASRLAEVAEQARLATGVQMEFVDIGGGFGVPYGDGEPELDLAATADAVVAGLESKLSHWTEPLPWLIAEPGRYLVADAGYLVGKVCGIKRGTRTYVGLDAGANIFMRRVLYGTTHRIMVDSARAGIGEERTVTICGQLSDNNDILASDVLLPEVDVGDLLVLRDAGAYGSVRASNFGAWPLPAEVLVRSGQYSVVRKAQSPGAFLAQFEVPEHLRCIDSEAITGQGRQSG